MSGLRTAGATHPWIAMAAAVLADPRPSLPVTEVAAALARDLHAAVVWSAVVGGETRVAAAGRADEDGVTCVWLRGGPGRGSVPRGAALRLVRALAEAPVDDVRFALEGDGAADDDDGGRRARTAGESARCREPDGRSRSGVVALTALPLCLGRRTRWLVVGRSRPFSVDERAFVRTVHALLAGLAGHVALVTTGPPPTAGGAAAGPGVATAGVALTSREQSVLALMAQGLISGAIGRRLGVSPRTVAKHQEHIYRKLDASDRLSAVLRAQEAGLLARPGEATSA